MKEKVIDVSIPFECPFNIGMACALDDNISFQLECGMSGEGDDMLDKIPAECPLHKSDYVIRLAK